LGGSDIALYECAGKTYSIAEFSEKHKHLLSKFEQALLDECRAFFAKINVPKRFNKCLTRSIEFARSKTPSFRADRSGGRSAYLAAQKLKLKGCRPVLDGTDFPIEILPFGAEKISYERIPFGTMRAESVMREILAYCFLRHNGLPVHSTPICVYEYSSNVDSCGYCLVSKTEGEVRLEEFIEYPKCTVEDVAQAQANGQQMIADCVIGSELHLRDVNIWWYVEQKSKFLIEMHFKGGFRGILNSNVGNDVIVTNEDGGLEMFLCDFDTFRLVPIPERPDMTFQKGFALQCMVEVAKGSVSILEYVDLGLDCTHLQIADELGKVYFNKSCLWRSYRRRFYQEAARRQWDINLVYEAFDEMRRAEAFANVLCGCILNSHYVSKLSKDRAVFYPHN
jgi:hypothetical protein